MRVIYREGGLWWRWRGTGVMYHDGADQSQGSWGLSTVRMVYHGGAGFSFTYKDFCLGKVFNKSIPAYPFFFPFFFQWRLSCPCQFHSGSMSWDDWPSIPLWNACKLVFLIGSHTTVCLDSILSPLWVWLCWVYVCLGVIRYLHFWQSEVFYIPLR